MIAYHFPIQFWDIEPQMVTVFPDFTKDYVDNRWVIIGQSQISSKLAGKN